MTFLFRRKWWKEKHRKVKRVQRREHRSGWSYETNWGGSARGVGVGGGEGVYRVAGGSHQRGPERSIPELPFSFTAIIFFSPLSSLRRAALLSIWAKRVWATKGCPVALSLPLFRATGLVKMQEFCIKWIRDEKIRSKPLSWPSRRELTETGVNY